MKVKKIFSLFLLSLWFLPAVLLAASPNDAQGQPGEFKGEGLGQIWDLIKGGSSATGEGTGDTGGLNVIQDVAYGKDNQVAQLPMIAYNIIRAFLTILGIMFLVIIVYAGFRWMTAGGEEEKINDAKRWIRNGIIGLAIIFTAYAITLFVFTNLVSSVKK